MEKLKFDEEKEAKINEYQALMHDFLSNPDTKYTINDVLSKKDEVSEAVNKVMQANPRTIKRKKR